MRLHIFEHEASCGPGAIGEWLALRDVEARRIRFHQGDEVPPLHDLEALIILGGAMNVYQDEQFPHLKAVRAFAREALSANKKVFGICLGAQIMADALGSRVTRAAQAEKGWIEIMRRDEATLSPLLSWLPARQAFISWHGDTFSVPPSAIHGAASETCPAQAFAWGQHALAVQFHPEADAPTVSGWIEDEPESARPALRQLFLPYESHFQSQKQTLFAALDAWADH